MVFNYFGAPRARPQFFGAIGAARLTLPDTVVETMFPAGVCFRPQIKTVLKNGVNLERRKCSPSSETPNPFPDSRQQEPSLGE